MSSRAVAPVTTDGALLRPIGVGDLATTLSWRNHADSRRWFHSTSEIEESQHRAWFDAYWDRDDDFVFIVEKDGVPVAQAALYDVGNGEAEFGRLLVDPARRGEGLSHLAIDLCLVAARDRLGLRAVHLEVKADNVRAIAAYGRAGFAVDAVTSARPDCVIMRRRLV